MNRELLRKVIDEVLVCPACEGKLAIARDFTSLECTRCETAYAITDGIPVLLPSQPSAQESELSFRDSLASQYDPHDRQQLLEKVALHHSIPLMRRQASLFQSRFAPDELILDIGIGFGWHWAGENPRVTIVGIDASLGNLKLAQQLLDEQDSVILVCADAAALPIRSHIISGFWSVQVFQHFPDEMVPRVHTELRRVLKDTYIGEIYNLNPALLHRAIYRLFGKRLHLRGRLGEMELNRLSAAELEGLWAPFGEKGSVSSSYSELFFHPDFRLRPRRYPIMLEDTLVRHMPGLAALFARQVQVRVDTRSL